ncbi:MAG: hypothetical protein WCH11_01855, partial [Bdellovibrio sp.]
MVSSLLSQMFLAGVLGFSVEAHASLGNDSRIRCSEMIENNSSTEQSLWPQSATQSHSKEYLRAERARIFFNQLRNSIEADF